MHGTSRSEIDTRLKTGTAGLDIVLHGGLTPNRLYLVEGTPGSGKTTLALKFLLDGREQGKRGLYITLSETEEELRASSRSHGWSLEGIDLCEMVDEYEFGSDHEQSLLHPSEACSEFPEISAADFSAQAFFRSAQMYRAYAR